MAAGLLLAGCAAPALHAGDQPAAGLNSRLHRLFPGLRLRYGGIAAIRPAAKPRSMALPGANDLLVAGHDVLAATTEGIWRSSDGGTTWEHVLGGAQFWSLTAIAGGGYAALGDRLGANGTGPAVLAVSADGVHWLLRGASARTGSPLPLGYGYRIALSGTGRHGTGIAVPDDMLTFITARPLRTSDGGRTWMPVTSSRQGALVPRTASTGLAMTDGGRTFYVTAAGGGRRCAGAVWRSADAGLTWSLLRGSCEPYPLLSVQFTSASDGFAAGGLPLKYGGGQVVERTTDGGRSWQTVRLIRPRGPNPPSGFVRLDMTGALHGWAIDGGCVGGQNGPCDGLVYATNDGGRTWRATGQPATSVAALTTIGSRAIAGDDDRAITAITADDGHTWDLQTRPGWISADQFSGIGGSLAWTTSLGGYTSTDAGEHWALVSQLTAARFRYETWLAAPAGRLLGLPGSGGRTVAISADGGRTWTSSKVPDRRPGDALLTGALGTDGTAIAVTGPGAECVSAAKVRRAESAKPGWSPSASGPSTMFTSSDGGSRWNSSGVSLPFNVGYTAAAAADGREVAVIDACNRLRLSSDGGRNWVAQTISKDVFCSVATASGREHAELWLACQSGTAGFWLLHSADGGLTWTAFRLPSAVVTQGLTAFGPPGPILAIRGVAATGPGDAVMSGGGSIWRTADGGRSLTQYWPALSG